jgi:hypothetical protein
MKKCLKIFIAVLMICSLCACDTPENDITLTESFPQTTETAITTVTAAKKTATTTVTTAKPQNTESETTKKRNRSIGFGAAPSPDGEADDETTTKTTTASYKPSDNTPVRTEAPLEDFSADNNDFVAAKYTFADNGLFIRDEYGEHYIGNTFIYSADGKATSTKDTLQVWNDYLDYSLDRKSAAFIQAIGYQLHFVSAEKMEPTFIDYHAQYFEMASSGGGIAFVDNSEMSRAHLYLWNGKTTTLISENCYEQDEFLISPDGQAVLYHEKEGSQREYYYYKDGVSTYIDEDITPVGFSENGDIIYYEKWKVLYAQKGSDVAGRTEVYDSRNLDQHYDGIFSFNKNHSELMFSYGDKLLHTKNGAKATLIADDFSYSQDAHFFPDYTAVCEDMSSRTFGIDSFAGTLYIDSENSLYCFDRQFNMKLLKKDFVRKKTAYGTGVETKFYLSRDGYVVTYRENDKVYRFDVRSPKSVMPYDTPHAVLALPTADGNAIYYFEEDKDLYYVCLYYLTADGEKKLLTDELHYENLNFYLGSCFITDSDELYFINNGGFWHSDKNSATKLSELNGIYYDMIYEGGLFFLNGINNFGNEIAPDEVVTKDGKYITIKV